MSHQRSREVGRAAMGRKYLTLTTQTPTRVSACPCRWSWALWGWDQGGGGDRVFWEVSRLQLLAESGNVSVFRYLNKRDPSQQCGKNVPSRGDCLGQGFYAGRL